MGRSAGGALVEVGAAVRHFPEQHSSSRIAATAALLLLVFAHDAPAAVVRSVHAIPAAAATRVIVEVEGAFRYRTHASEDGRTLFVDIDGATLAEGAPRIVPVSDRRLDGVIVLDDAVARVVRVSVDFAGRSAPRLESVAEGSRLVLSFVDGSEAPPAAERGARGGGTSHEGRTPPDRDAALARAGSETASAAALATRRKAARSTRADAASGARTSKPDPVRSGSPSAAARSRPPASGVAQSARPGLARRSVLERPVVVLDPGHGGKDPGAQAWTGEYEKDIVLDLAERVARRLRKNGEVDVVMTRSGDEYVELADRRDTSRKWGADVFVSIHANASASGAARGIETYYHSAGKAGAGPADKEVRRLARAENGGKASRDRTASRGGLSRASLATGAAPVLDRRPESIRLARSVQAELVQSLGMRYETVRDLGAKEGPFFVIGDNAAPSVLVEAAFLTHREEGLRMRSEVYREQIADGIARGILAFVEQQRGAGAL